MAGASISNTTAPVKAIFALDVGTASLAFLLFSFALGLAIVRFRNGRARSFAGKGITEDDKTAPLKTTLATELFLIPALFSLCVAYAVQSAVVSLQINVRTPISVTPAYIYHHLGELANLTSSETRYGKAISILSFTEELGTILSTTFLTGGVWLHSTNLTTNGTRVVAPGTFSRIWNTFIICGILGLGLATWSRGLYVRGGGMTASSYSSTISNDQVTRILFIVFRCWVTMSSTSVSIQVIKDYANLKKNGTPNNTERPILKRFVFIVVPLIWLRNSFIIVDIVLIYQKVTNWSRVSREALAFLLIITRQYVNLCILAMVLLGAWSMGRSAGTGEPKHSQLSNEGSNEGDA